MTVPIMIAVAGPGTVAGLHVGSTGPVFLAVLAVHIPAALAALVTGAAAARADKHHPRHGRYGTAYFACLALACATATVLAALRWQQNWPLFLLGAAAFSLAAIGRRRPGETVHIFAMGGSYTVLLTAFFVDNAPHLPLWQHLPPLAFWLGPTLIALPVLTHAARPRTRRS